MRAISSWPGRLAGLLLSLTAAVAWGAGEQTGRISGVITAAGSKTPIPGATVSATSPALIGGPREVATDDDGRYELAVLPPGVYRVEVGFEGVKPVERKVVVRQGETTPLNVSWSLEMAATQTYVIQEERHLTKPDSTQSGTVISADTEAKVASPRRYQYLAQQVAGVNGGLGNQQQNPVVRGANANSNRYMVDGIDITDPTDNQLSANINFDSIRSVEILTGGMEAQYNSLGGVINLVTAEGSDQLHVDSSFYFNSEKLSFGSQQGPSLFHGTRPFSELPPPPNSSYQVNLNVSGPILKSRLWANLSIEYLYQQYSQPAGALLGVQNPPFTRNQVLPRLKLTWAATRRDRVALSLAADPASLNNYDMQFGSAGNKELAVAEGHQTQGGVFTTVQWDHFFTDNINFNLQTGYQWQLLDHGPQGILGDISDFGPRAPQFSDSNYHYDPNRPRHVNKDDGSIWYQGGNVSRDRRNTVEFDPSLAMRGKWLGYHDAKMGIQLRYIQHSNSLHTPGGSSYVDRGGGAGESGLCDQTTGKGCYQRVDTPDFNSHQWGFGIGGFIQDRWKPIPRLTILPGIRFDFGTTQNTLGQTVSSLFGVGPRLGATLDVTGDQKTIISAFYGRSTETLSLAAAIVADVSATSSYNKWDAKSGAFQPSYTTGGAGGYLIDRKLTAPHADEITGGIRREIFHNSVASVDYTYKKVSNIWDGVEVNQIWDPTGTSVLRYANGVPQQVFKYTTPDQNYRVYQGLDFVIEGRPTPNWDIYASYTLSWLYGPGAEELGLIAGEVGNSAFYNPRQAVFYNGFLADDHRHLLKLRASYSAHGFSVGGFFTYVSGAPLGRQYFNNADGDYTNYRSPQGTDPVTPNQHSAVSELRWPDYLNLDARAQYDLADLIHQHVVVILDVFNVFDLQNASRVEVADVKGFGLVTRRQDPLRIQLGIRYVY